MNKPDAKICKNYKYNQRGPCGGAHVSGSDTTDAGHEYDRAGQGEATKTAVPGIPNYLDSQ